MIYHLVLLSHKFSISFFVFGCSTFNFSVPELSWLAVVLLILAFFVLYFIPIRILLLIWGCTKFSRRLIRPHSVPNNEVLDLLSRVPDDDQLVNLFHQFNHFSCLFKPFLFQYFSKKILNSCFLLDHF